MIFNIFTIAILNSLFSFFCGFAVFGCVCIPPSLSPSHTHKHARVAVCRQAAAGKEDMCVWYT